MTAPPDPEKRTGPGAATHGPAIFPTTSHTSDNSDRSPGQDPLRPYQRDTVTRVHAELARIHRVLVVLATGAGKTVVATALIGDYVRQGGRVIFLAHRRELISQAAAKLFRAGIDCGVVQAGVPARPGVLVQVCSISTLHARAVRGRAMDLPPADLIVVDEAHHIRARTYQQILAQYPDADVVGLTATPCRGDGRGLGASFGVIVEAATVAQLTQAGYLVPARFYAPSRPDMVGVETRGGDYVEAQMAEKVDRPELVGDIVEHHLRLAQGRPTVLFAAGVRHSMHLRDQFRLSGLMAEHIDGSTPTEERDATLKAFAEGRVDIITNAAVLTEGWDAPAASCVVLARPTKSLGLFRQMVGRVLRPAPGKTDALVLDHAGACFEHGLPDDEIEWTLAEDRRASNKRQASRRAGKAPALAECPECKAVRMSGRPCPACGWRPQPKPKEVEVADGELGQVDRYRLARMPSPDAAERARFHRQLVFIAREKGFQVGWAAHKYRERFGDWPPSRYVSPLEPDEATRRWVKSRAIAFAKSRSRAA